MLKAVVGGSGGGSAAGITIGTSIITGGTDTRVLFDDAGVVGESAGVTYVKATGMLSAGLSGSAAAWTTSGIRLIANAASFTDTSSSGTVAVAYTDLHGASTILASSATTYTRYYGAFFVAPVASTNVTMTNKSALGADSISTAGAAQGTDSLAIGGTARFFGAVTALSSINGTSSAAIAGFGSGTFVGSTPQMTLGVLNTTAGGLRLFGTSGSAVVTLSSSLATSNVAAIGTGSGDASGQLNAAAIAINPVAAAKSILTSTGGSNTGSDQTSAVDLSWTLNTSGSPDVFALRVTDTARGASTRLFNIYGGASGTSSLFSIDRSGNAYASSLFLATGGVNNNAGGTGANFDIGFLTGNQMKIDGLWTFLWNTNNSNLAGAFTTSLSKASDGVLQVGTSAANALGSLNLTNLTATGIITVPGAATALLTTAATATSGAGASLGTLSNAPSAGNPTSWLKIVDNGVTRYIPAW